MKEDAYQNAIDYFTDEIVKRLKRRKHIDVNEQQSQMTDDLDAICEDIAADVSDRMGWK